MKRMYIFTLLIIFVISVIFLCDEKEHNKEFLKEYNIQAEYEPISVETIIIPNEFDSYYEEYNLLQLQSGFDISEYKGKKVKKYTYEMLNFPNCDDTVLVNILCRKIRIIGGEIVSPSIKNGFILPLKYMKNYKRD